MGGAVVMIGVVVVVMTAEEEEDDDDVATAAGGCFTFFNVLAFKCTKQMMVHIRIVAMHVCPVVGAFPQARQ
jgi:hypothetical protein